MGCSVFLGGGRCDDSIGGFNPLNAVVHHGLGFVMIYLPFPR